MKPLSPPEGHRALCAAARGHREHVRRGPGPAGLGHRVQAPGRGRRVLHNEGLGRRRAHGRGKHEHARLGRRRHGSTAEREQAVRRALYSAPRLTRAHSHEGYLPNFLTRLLPVSLR